MDDNSSWVESNPDDASMYEEDDKGLVNNDRNNNDDSKSMSEGENSSEHESNRDGSDDPNDNTIVDYGTSAIFNISLQVKSAGRKVSRWKTDHPPATRGSGMAQYLLYKMEKDKFHTKLLRDDYVKVRIALRSIDLEFIREELLHHQEVT